MIVSEVDRESQPVGILGAGMAGLGAAWERSRRGISSMVLEKSRALSGRATTRSHGRCRYDRGANFLKLADDLVGIPGRVDVFDRAGNIHLPHPELEETARLDPCELGSLRLIWANRIWTSFRAPA